MSLDREMSRDRKTLLLVDEHGKLFDQEPYLPNKITSLGPLSSFDWWDELYKGTRLIFTGTAHAREDVTKATNCVPRELLTLSDAIQDLPDPISAKDLQLWMGNRTDFYRQLAETYYNKCNELTKE
ncbi:hypothetical protein BGZ73_008925 [Actinomortierella ambigua]|nr:hypothetical protein BGZ73_008925 [Actinomortierella ambigua]